jgi:hypothetical protein
MRNLLSNKYATTATKINNLIFMHTFMMQQDDEDYYGIWISGGVPDEPYYDILEFIAKDYDLYLECYNLFMDLYNRITREITSILKDEIIDNMNEEIEKLAEEMRIYICNEELKKLERLRGAKYHA